jgi:hypothetical protein
MADKWRNIVKLSENIKHKALIFLKIMIEEEAMLINKLKNYRK